MSRFTPPPGRNSPSPPEARQMARRQGPAGAASGPNARPAKPAPTRRRAGANSAATSAAATSAAIVPAPRWTVWAALGLALFLSMLWLAALGAFQLARALGAG